MLLLLFMLSIAVSAGTVYIAYQLRSRHKQPLFTTLLYMLAFFFTFGFYAFWGQVIISIFISPFVSAALHQRIIDIALLLGSPFLIIAWFMLLKLMVEIAGREVKKVFVIWFLGANVFLLVITGYGITFFPNSSILQVIKYYYISMNFTYTILALVFLLSGKKQQGVISYKGRVGLAVGLTVVFLVQNSVVLFYNGSNVLVAFLFIFVYYLGNGFCCIYLKLSPAIASQPAQPSESLTLDAFCQQYEISPRETDIIREVCNGFTNQQIADKLFISLQTVKDHTSRIYSKTNTANRVQLIKLVQTIDQKIFSK